MSNERILVVTLGGTIESFYDVAHTPDYVPLEAPSIIPQALDRLGFAGQYDHYPVDIRDSKSVMNAQLDHILLTLAEKDYDKVVIVQGTDTLAIHGRYLAEKLKEYDDWNPHGKLGDKTIVLTGSLGPLRDENKQWRDPETDRVKNDGWDVLSQAMADARTLHPGVFVETGRGPESPFMIDKARELSAPDANGLREVLDAGFVSRDPAKGRIEPF